MESTSKPAPTKKEGGTSSDVQAAKYTDLEIMLREANRTQHKIIVGLKEQIKQLRGLMQKMEQGEKIKLYDAKEQYRIAEQEANKELQLTKMHYEERLKQKDLTI